MLRCIGMVLVMLMAGCGDGDPDLSEVSSTKTIGVEGGEIELGDARLVVPAGALDGDLTITLSEVNTLKDDHAEWLHQDTPLWRLEPEGTQFLDAVTVELRLPASSELGSEQEVRDAYPAATWATDGKFEFLQYSVQPDGDGWVLRASNDHFSAIGFLSWRHFKYAAWRAGTILWTAGGVVVDGLEVLGAAIQAGACDVAGRGEAGQPPCPGPYDANGNRKPLCLGPAFADDEALQLDEATGLCECVANCNDKDDPDANEDCDVAVGETVPVKQLGDCNPVRIELVGSAERMYAPVNDVDFNGLIDVPPGPYLQKWPDFGFDDRFKVIVSSSTGDVGIQPYESVLLRLVSEEDQTNPGYRQANFRQAGFGSAVLAFEEVEGGLRILDEVGNTLKVHTATNELGFRMLAFSSSLEFPAVPATWSVVRAIGDSDDAAGDDDDSAAGDDDESAAP